MIFKTRVTASSITSLLLSETVQSIVDFSKEFYMLCQFLLCTKSVSTQCTNSVSHDAKTHFQVGLLFAKLQVPCNSNVRTVPRSCHYLFRYDTKTSLRGNQSFELQGLKGPAAGVYLMMAMVRWPPGLQSPVLLILSLDSSTHVNQLPIIISDILWHGILIPI